MRRRRAGSKYTWFPVDPTRVQVSEDVFDVTYFSNTLTVSSGTPGVSWGVSATPLTVDYTHQAPALDTPGISLRDVVEGQSWLCKRLVGKCWGAFSQSGDLGTIPPETPLEIIVCMAVAVLPVDDNGFLDLTADEIDPLLSANVQQPWMWRRTWTLYNNTGAQQVGGEPGGGFSTGPTNITNVAAGTYDAGHVDTRGVSRRIRREQRLFWITTARTLRGSAGEGEGPASFSWGYDLRILGAMRRERNRSSFK